jgi:hypothetical protein
VSGTARICNLPDALMEALELFGKKVLPHIRDI